MWWLFDIFLGIIGFSQNSSENINNKEQIPNKPLKNRIDSNVQEFSSSPSLEQGFQQPSQTQTSRHDKRPFFFSKQHDLDENESKIHGIQHENPFNNAFNSRYSPTFQTTNITAESPVPSPSLQEELSPRKTLVLDLDETLVHSTTANIGSHDLSVDVELEGYLVTMYVSKRPFVDEFLETVCSWYEVVIFTASLSQYASVVIDAIDPKKLIKKRLYRGSCTALPFGGFVKDLSVLNKPLKDVIIIDNSPVAYSWHRDNAIPIPDWWGPRPGEDDRCLLDLLGFLEALKETDDVRPILSLKDKHINQQQQQQQQQHSPPPQQQLQQQPPPPQIHQQTQPQYRIPSHLLS